MPTYPDTLNNHVKAAIMKTWGYTDPDPTLLREDKSMDDFSFTTAQNLALTASLNTIARKYKPDALIIPISSLTACDTVKDCIDLVQNAIA